MYCQKCGKELEDNVAFCENCGTSVSNTENVPKKRIDILFPAFIILGFLATVVSLIVSLVLYFIFEKDNHDRAVAAVAGAIIGIVLKIVYTHVMPLIFFLSA